MDDVNDLILAAARRIEQRRGMPTPATYEQIKDLEERHYVIIKDLCDSLGIVTQRLDRLELQLKELKNGR